MKPGTAVDVPELFGYNLRSEGGVQPANAPDHNGLVQENEMAAFTPITTARFWSKVNVGDRAECWPWRAKISGKGYGGFQDMKAHRVAYELLEGPIPEGMMLCHHCDNPKCVNPSHMFIGAAADNNRDCMEKGRHGCPRGEKHPNSKLSDADVAAIRASNQRGVDLARLYGVATSTISEILSYKWRV